MKYPPTSEQREQIIKSQSKQCLICGTHPDEFVIDHDHRTGEVRGALCSACNTGIGMLKDDPAILWAAVAYLEGYRGLRASDTLDIPVTDPCPGSWEPALRVSPRIYRCGECDQPVGNVSPIKMELIGRGRYLVREHYRRGEEPGKRGRGKSPRMMSAVEAIY